MNGSTLGGVLVVIFGLVMAADAKMFGFKSPIPGIIVAAAGMFFALFGTYGNTGRNSNSGGGRRVKDYTV